MTAISQEVVSMYEEANLSPEQIAEDTGFQLAAVKATLTQFSKVYRDVLKEKGATRVSEMITDDELSEMLDVVKSLARYSEIEGIKLKAACRIIDEKENRLNVINEVKNANYNLIMFNQQLLANRRAKEKVIELVNNSEQN